MADERAEAIRSEGNEIATGVNDVALAIQSAPEMVLADARRAAIALTKVIASKPRAAIIHGNRYLEIDDWQLLARFYGVTAQVLDQSVQFIELDSVTGFRASAVALNATGRVISQATGYCMRDEPYWAKKELHQLASLAQTRACSKVLANVLRWVAVMGGYATTPAEELPAEEMPPHHSQGRRGTRPAASDRAETRPPISQEADPIWQRWTRLRAEAEALAAEAADDWDPAVPEISLPVDVTILTEAGRGLRERVLARRTLLAELARTEPEPVWPS